MTFFMIYYWDFGIKSEIGSCEAAQLEKGINFEKEKEKNQEKKVDESHGESNGENEGLQNGDRDLTRRRKRVFLLKK